MPAQTSIDICIATFRRPLILLGLLDSLTAQELDGLALRVIVVDNDHAQSARHAVEAFRYGSSAHRVQEVVYDVEPQQSIALTRNRAMRHVTADYLAFVDDDETVSREWLRSLFDTLLRFDADVVFGPVISVLPATAPAWAKRCFRRTRFVTGQPLQHYGAGNVLLRRRAVANERLRFDPAFGLTGGEDTDFFYRLHLGGCKMVWCDEAVASEPVPSDRLTLDWIRRRGFSGGQTYARIFVSRYALPRKVVWFTGKIAQLAVGIPVAAVLRLVSYPSYVAFTVRLAGAAGQLAACFSGGYVEEYRTRHSQ